MTQYRKNTKAPCNSLFYFVILHFDNFVQFGVMVLFAIVAPTQDTHSGRNSNGIEVKIFANNIR